MTIRYRFLNEKKNSKQSRLHELSIKLDMGSNLMPEMKATRKSFRHDDLPQILERKGVNAKAPARIAQGS